MKPLRMTHGNSLSKVVYIHQIGCMFAQNGMLQINKKKNS